MKFVAITFDNQHYQFDESAKEIVNRKWRKGEIINFKTGSVKGTDIRRIEPLQNNSGTNLGSGLKLTSEQIFQLPSGEYSENFWFKILQVNNQRKSENKPWIYKSAIEFAKKETGVHSPSELFDFIDAEWETVKQHNVGNQVVDLEGKKSIKMFLESEEGRKYAMHHA